MAKRYSDYTKYLREVNKRRAKGYKLDKTWLRSEKSVNEMIDAYARIAGSRSVAISALAKGVTRHYEKGYEKAKAEASRIWDIQKRAFDAARTSQGRQTYFHTRKDPRLERALTNDDGSLEDCPLVWQDRWGRTQRLWESYQEVLQSVMRKDAKYMRYKRWMRETIEKDQSQAEIWYPDN